MSYRIIIDAAADADPSVLKKKNIEVITMKYSLGDQMLTYTGMADEQAFHAFYDSQRHGDLTQTTQITPFEYKDIFTKAAEAGEDIIYLCLSSGLSSTFQSACTAQKELQEEYPDRKIYPIDTLSATGGIGVYLERALQNQKHGMTVDENYEDLMNLRGKVRTIFFVRDLNYLKRGGRVSKTEAVVGTVLGIRPMLRIADDGTLIKIEKEDPQGNPRPKKVVTPRGSQQACDALQYIFKETNHSGKDDILYICHGDASNDAKNLERLIKEITNNTVKVQQMSPIIGAHTGPGMVCVSYVTE